jgi:hypothetical protein
MSLIPATLDATTSIISCIDPAIDHEASDTKAFAGLSPDKEILSYIGDRFERPSSWRDTVKFKDGASPTVFVIGVIPPAILNRIDDECRTDSRPHEKHWRAFLHGVREIENGPTISVVKDGRTIKTTPKTEINGVEYVDSQWLSSTFIRGLRNVAIEIGAVCYHWNQMSETDVKN